MSDTPRTDAYWATSMYDADSGAEAMHALAQELERELAAVTAERDALRFLLAASTNTLRRYRTESPPGHQPHMICHVADEIIEKSEAALRGRRE